MGARSADLVVQEIAETIVVVDSRHNPGIDENGKGNRPIPSSPGPISNRLYDGGVVSERVEDVRDCRERGVVVSGG